TAWRVIVLALERRGRDLAGHHENTCRTRNLICRRAPTKHIDDVRTRLRDHVPCALGADDNRFDWVIMDDDSLSAQRQRTGHAEHALPCTVTLIVIGSARRRCRCE